MVMTEYQTDLVIAAQNGDVTSFELLYDIYYKKVYGFARMLMKNDQDAQDILQETFITVWRKLNTLKEAAAFAVWIQIIAKNLCYMQLKRKNIEILLDGENDIENFDIVESEDFLPSVYTERKELKENLAKIIDDLSLVQRQTIILYYFNEFSIEEISKIMECSVGTVKSRLFLARNTIKAEIQEQESKTGQKFYGIVGIPVLLFGKHILAYMDTFTISETTAIATLNAIKSAITTVVETIKNSQSTNIIKEEIEMATKQTLTTKIIIGVTAFATVAAAAVLVIKLTGIIDKPKPPVDDDLITDIDIVDNDDTDKDTNDVTTSNVLDDVWADLAGYWVVDKKDESFISFYNNNNGEKVIEFGYFASGYWRAGSIIEVNIIDGDKVDVKIQVPKQTGMDEFAAYKETFSLDFSDFTSNNTFKVKTNAFNNKWQTFKYGGIDLEAAYDNR